MARLIRIAILIACILFAGRAYAGGACPSGANYINPSNANGPRVTLSSLGIESCYYIAANGSDSNSGTDESHPWLHAPKMPSCSGNCAAVQSAAIPAGTGFIVRGGDTWHMGNSSPTDGNPYTGGTWNFTTSPAGNGTSSAWIYVGIDPNWFSGSSWARPIMNADNPLCNASLLNGTTCNSSGITGLSGATQYYVSSCTYTIAGGTNNFIEAGAKFWYYFDNFEYTGMCQSGNGQPGHNNRVFSFGALGSPNQVNTFANNYFHGWTHVHYAGSNGGSNCTSSTTCINISMFEGGTSSGAGANYLFNVMDGSDSDPEAGMWATSGNDQYHVAYNVIRYTSQGLANLMHSWHDNLLEYFFENGHSNILENNGESPGPINMVYNNVFRHLETSGATGGVGVLLSPPNTSVTDYMFNNVFYDEDNMELVGLSQSQFGNPKGTMVFFNNTLELGTINVVSCYVPSGRFILQNNHYISDHTPYGGIGGTCAPFATNELILTHAQADANKSPKFNQYTNLQTLANSPVASTNSTVGTGANAQAYCNKMLASSDTLTQLAGAACQSGGTYAVAYDQGNHTAVSASRTMVSRPIASAWDMGAYQFSSSPGPQPPTKLQAQVQ